MSIGATLQRKMYDRVTLIVYSKGRAGVVRVRHGSDDAWGIGVVHAEGLCVKLDKCHWCLLVIGQIAKHTGIIERLKAVQKAREDAAKKEPPATQEQPPCAAP